MTAATSTAAPRFTRLAAWLRSDRAPVAVHYGALALGAILSLVAATRMWFFYDDWAFLVPSLTDPWLPHVGHWSTAPFLLFHALRDVFGLSSFVPFAIPVTIAHLALAHLLWRFMLRVGVSAPLAAAASVFLVFLGAGAENILWAFQVGFIGAMVLALAVILLLEDARLTPLRVAAIVILAILAPTFSGTALPLLAIAALVGWLRHGLWRTALMLAPAAAIYLVWYLLEGRFAPPVGRAEGLQDLVTVVPVFGLRMLTDGFGRAFPVEILGPLFFAVVAIWGVLTWGGASLRAKPAYLLFLAAPLFALFTGYSRVNLGLDTAESSRYLYFVIAVMAPLLFLALDRARLLWKLPTAPVLVLVGILTVFNLGGLIGPLLTRAGISDESEHRLSAALAVIDADADHDIDPQGRPYAQWTPDVSVTDLQGLRDNGWFTPVGYTDTEYLDGVLGLEVHLAAHAPVVSTGCRDLLPGEAPVALGHDFTVTAVSGGSILLQLERAGSTSEQRYQPLDTGSTGFSVDAPAGVTVQVQANDPVSVCG